MRLALLVIISGCLVGCSAPQPPAISGKPQPVNINQPKTISPEMVLLSQIRNELIHNQETLAAMSQKRKPTPSKHFIIKYPVGGTQASIKQITPSLTAAKSACKVELLARTDGTIANKADKIVAQKRAINLRNQFVKYGVSPVTLFINYAASTDYADNNWSQEGRANNRRVVINIYTDCSEE